MLKKVLILLLIIQPVAFSEVRLRPEGWATRVIGTKLDNFYQMDAGVFRSEQPDTESFDLIEKSGIKEVLNLRQHHTDVDETKKTKLVLHQIKVDTGKVSYQQIFQALEIIKNADGPILLHCWHGSDRTGVISASYRMVFQNWSRDQAIDEFKNGGYGYHQIVYPQLINVIQNLDVASFRKKLGISRDR